MTTAKTIKSSTDDERTTQPISDADLVIDATQRAEDDTALNQARTLLQSSAPALDDLKRAIVVMSERSDAAATRVGELAAARLNLLIYGSAAELVAHDKDAALAEVSGRQAAAIVAALHTKLEPVAAAARAAAIDAERAAVERLMDAAGVEMEKLPRFTVAIRKMIGAIASADQAAAVFARAHPDETSIATAESRVRWRAPATSIREERQVWTWRFADGRIEQRPDHAVVAPDPGAEVNKPLLARPMGRDSKPRRYLGDFATGAIDPKGPFVFRSHNGTGEQVWPVKALRREIERRGTTNPDSLAASIKLPPLRAGDIGWALAEPRTDIFSVIAALDAAPAEYASAAMIEVRLDPIAP